MMRKRILALLLAVTMAVTMLAVPAGAAGTEQFSDVSDSSTATAVEILRLMGVLDGYGDGTFRPQVQLNRGQFCKMAIHMMGGSGELGKYRTVTVFPDVKPSHWAAAYVNMAAKGAGVIAGYPDGKFHPERTVTAGQAVTILLRLLGYKDEDIGGVWPVSQMAMGESIGLTDGTGLANGNAALTRAQAAKLFVNLLQAEKKDGGTYYTLSEKVTLTAVDGGAGTMTAGGKTYDMVRSVPSTTLVGAQGRVVLNGDNQAMTFLPETTGSGVSGSVILYANGAATEINALAGRTDYTMYKNGIPATVSDLRKYDVATYSADSNTVRVCDTRITVYYENCSPSPKEPAVVEVLGGTQLNVLPAARESVAKFRPGDMMTLLLTADGQVAGAVATDTVAARGNAACVVSDEGIAHLICGAGTVELAFKADSEYFGRVVRVSSGKTSGVKYSVLSGGVKGNLDVTAQTVGTKKLAPNVMIFDAGKQVGLQQLSETVIPEKQVAYARTNWAGQVDLLVINADVAGTVYYGRATVTEREEMDVFGATVVRELEVTGMKSGQMVSSGTYATGYAVESGDYVAATLNKEKGRFTPVVVLTQLKDVSDSAWIGNNVVNVGGRTYTVSADVGCYNRTTGRWMTLDVARTYADTMNLFVQDGAVRVIEIK